MDMVAETDRIKGKRWDFQGYGWDRLRWSRGLTARTGERNKNPNVDERVYRGGRCAVGVAGTFLCLLLSTLHPPKAGLTNQDLPTWLHSAWLVPVAKEGTAHFKIWLVNCLALDSSVCFVGSRSCWTQPAHFAAAKFIGSMATSFVMRAFLYFTIGWVLLSFSLEYSSEVLKNTAKIHILYASRGLIFVLFVTQCSSSEGRDPWLTILYGPVRGAVPPGDPRFMASSRPSK